MTTITPQDWPLVAEDLIDQIEQMRADGASQQEIEALVADARAGADVDDDLPAMMPTAQDAEGRR